MRGWAIALAAVTLAASAASATGQASPPAPPKFRHERIEAPRQPGAIPLPVGSLPRDRKEEWFLQNGEIGVRNVVQPTLMPVLPAGHSTGTAVIVAPGGGFLGLSMDNEGWRIARWLANQGVAAFVLKYRVLPTPDSLEVFDERFNRMIGGEKVGFAPPEDTPPEPLADALAALRHVRENAQEYGVDPKRIGFMGFSAGGFLTRSVVAAAGDDMPAFAAPIYPNMKPMATPANAPPLFVLIAGDDFLLDRGGLGLVESWRAAKKPVEFHLLANGGHGFGYGRRGTASENWLPIFHHWLEVQGLLEPRD